MRYRRFGRLDWEVSALGFGVTRLPSLKSDPASIDEAEAVRMLRYAFDHGVNYVDLGYPHDLRQHERRVRPIGRVLQGGYREKVKVSASLPSSFIDSPSDFDSHLDKILGWLQAESLDFYLLGGLDRETWPRLKELGILRRAEAAISRGRIDYLGFSFHDDFQTLRGILNDYDSWTLCQFQYSYMDIDHHPGVGGLRYAAENGLAVVVTEPLRGGLLTKEPPETVAKVWAGAPQKRTLAEWGLLWVLNHPEVSSVVSDMGNMEQVVENVALADRVEPDSLTVPEQVLVSRVREAYLKLRPVPCTTCRACMPCPLGIDVPRIFELYNDATIYDDAATARYLYRMEGHRIDVCNECGDCARACGRSIDIPARLKETLRLFAESE